MALTNRWLHEQGVPDLSRRSPKGEDGYAHVMDHSSLRASSPTLTGTAGCGPAGPVVWEPRLALTGSVGATRFAVFRHSVNTGRFRPVTFRLSRSIKGGD